MNRTTYDNLPEKVEQIYNELQLLRKEILGRGEPVKQYPPYLDIDNAVEFLAEQGYTIAKSTLYKKTANREIPFSVFNARLVFETKELITWCYGQSNNKTKN